MEFFESINEDHRAFIAKQPVFFVATAAEGARINLSPKGMDSFRVLGDNQVAWLDVGGSGNETQAHLAVDGRITIMFCAFDRPALIMRLYGRGRFVLPQNPEWDSLIGLFMMLPGARQIFVAEITSLQTSCGWGVPFMAFERERETLSKYHAQQDPVARLAVMQTRNRSIDGLPVIPQDRMPHAE